MVPDFAKMAFNKFLSRSIEVCRNLGVENFGRFVGATGAGTLERFAVAKVGVGVLVDFARGLVATSGRSRCLPRRTGTSVGVEGAELCTASFGVRVTSPDEIML